MDFEIFIHNLIDFCRMFEKLSNHYERLPYLNHIIIAGCHHHFAIFWIEGYTIHHISVLVFGQTHSIISIPQVSVLILGATVWRKNEKNDTNFQIISQLLQIFANQHSKSSSARKL
jgi:hypothetical protein